MPFVGQHSELDQQKVKPFRLKVLNAISGEDPTIAANELLLLGLAIMLKGGVTRDQLMETLPQMVDSFPFPRSQ